MRKRVSLAEIQKEDMEAALPAKEAPTPTETIGTKNEQRRVEPATDGKNPPDKLPFMKLSVTLPEEMFYRLDDLSRLRRKEGKPFTKSELVREALGPLLQKALLR